MQNGADCTAESCDRWLGGQLPVSARPRGGPRQSSTDRRQRRDPTWLPNDLVLGSGFASGRLEARTVAVCDNAWMRSIVGTRVETVLVVAGFGLMILHNIDEAFVNLENGGKLNLVVVIIIAALALTFLWRLSLPWRGGILAVLGLLALVQGILGHVANIFTGKAAAIDYSGVLFAMGGALLLGLGLVVLAEWRTAVAARRP